MTNFVIPIAYSWWFRSIRTSTNQTSSSLVVPFHTYVHRHNFLSTLWFNQPDGYLIHNSASLLMENNNRKTISISLWFGTTILLLTPQENRLTTKWNSTKLVLCPELWYGTPGRLLLATRSMYLGAGLVLNLYQIVTVFSSACFLEQEGQYFPQLPYVWGRCPHRLHVSLRLHLPSHS